MLARRSLLLLWLAVTPALAQEAAPDTAQRLSDLERKVEEQQRELERLGRRPAPPEVPGAVAAASSATPFQWGYDQGFFLKTQLHGADFKIRPKGGVQLDYRAYPHAKPNDEFVLRRAKVGFEGSFGDFNYDIEIQPMRPTIPFVDAWLEYAPIDEVHVRFGHFKTPFSPHGMTIDFRLEFVERPMVVGSGNVVSPDYRPGAEVYGSFGGGLLRYWLAVENQPDSNNVVSGDPLVAARLESEVRGVTIGGAAYWERLAGTQNSFPGLTPGQFQFFKPVSVRGWTQAYEVDASVFMGPFWLRTEYMIALQERRRVLADFQDGTPLVTQGAFFSTGFLFWAPPPTVARPVAVPFQGWELFSLDVEKKKAKRFVGAELVCRLEWISIDDARGGRQGQNGVPAVPSTAANADKVKGNQAGALWFGLNVAPIENVIFMADYVHVRTGDLSRAERAHSRHADEFLFRAQLDF